MRDEVTVATCGRPSASTVTDVPPRSTRRRVGRRAQPRVERGAVSAEAAVVIPLLVALTLGLVWLVTLAVTQVRVVDAARETARAAARGDADGVAITHGHEVAPSGAEISVARSGGDVVAEVAVEVRGPGGLFGFLPAVPVTSRAVAAEEPR